MSPSCAGLAYYISPPNDFSNIVEDPLHAFCYILFVLFSCAIFSKYFIEISGSSSRDVAKMLRDRQIMFKGYREKSLLHVLNLYVPIAAAFGGMCIGNSAATKPGECRDVDTCMEQNTQFCISRPTAGCGISNYNLLIECCPETPPAPPPDIPASNLTPATGQGDPHIETFQGAHYTVANVGTFLAFNFSKKMLSLKVQFMNTKQGARKVALLSVICRPGRHLDFKMKMFHKSDMDFAGGELGQHISVEGPANHTNHSKVLFLSHSKKRFVQMRTDSEFQTPTGWQDLGGSQNASDYLRMLTIVADFMGAIGSGTGILLAVTIIYQHMENAQRERDQGTMLF
eukprot:g26828.t1